MDLNKIRELEGVFDFNPPAIVVDGMKRDPCEFAEIINYTAGKLFYCNYKGKCDNQKTYGSEKRYCERQMR